MRRFLVAGILTSLAAFLPGTTSPVAAQANPTTRAAAIVEPAIVYLEAHWTAWVRVPRAVVNQFELPSATYANPRSGDGQVQAWNLTSRCSGFVVSPDGYVATAGHCVDHSKDEGIRSDVIRNYAIPFVLEQGGYDITDENVGLVEEIYNPYNEWRVEGLTNGTPPDLELYVQRGVAAGGVTTGETMTARVIDYQKLSNGDVALIKVEERNMPTLELAPQVSIEVGTQVLSAGYPGAADEVTDATYTPTFQDGSINSKKTREGGALPVYEVSSEMTGGMSGGPATDLRGRVVGINSYGDLSGSYNFISPVTLLQEMMDSHGVESRLGPVDQAYRAGLEAFFAGDFDRAAYEFDRATGLSPKHQQAQEYLQKSRARGGDPLKGAPSEEGGGGTILTVIVGAATSLILLGGGAALLLVWRRRRRARTPQEEASAAGILEDHEAQVVANGESEGDQETLVAAAVTEKQTPTLETPQADSRSSATMREGLEPEGQGAAPKTRFCPECGSSARLQARFCENCGHRFS